ncbi:uncharacterized protein DUF3137 [Litorimonas taeanensis]|uniref:Uncharacterized protein DUF3137 n=1 Tax=Litorimonas taeanensis TaxID=568099 RepID=A0A420WLF4_9PROT|nr:DUF3137 domain-containing protein [Litorimonas taeanensis]RKQ71742.1 uncharacterized protein DUF3137 [Litorimonas taeanensis]
MQPSDFNIGHPELKGFEAHYDKEVLPYLQAQEAVRLDAILKTKILSAIIVVLSILATFLVFRLSSNPKFNILPMFLGAAAIMAVYAYLTASVRSATKEKIVGAICGYVGWTFVSKVKIPPDLTIWSTLRLLPKVDSFLSNRRASFEDHIFGAAHGTEFESIEFHIEERSDKKWRTLMRGQMMSLTFPQRFLGTTVVLRDKKIFQSKTIANMKRVGLVDPVFEDIFEAYGTDQVEARYLLTPTFMQRLVDLEKSVSGKNIRFGFCEGRLLIIVETPNQFEAGSMFSTLLSTERTQKILDEIAAVFHLVDGVMKPLPRHQ